MSLWRQRDLTFLAPISGGATLRANRYRSPKDLGMHVVKGVLIDAETEEVLDSPFVPMDRGPVAYYQPIDGEPCHRL